MSCEKQDSHRTLPPKIFESRSNANEYGCLTDVLGKLGIIENAPPGGFIGAGKCNPLAAQAYCENSNIPFMTLKDEEPILLKSSSSEGVFYLDTNCTQPLTTGNIGPGPAAKIYYYKGLSIGPITFTISDGGSLGLKTSSTTLTMTAITDLVFSIPALNQKTSDCGHLAIEAHNSAGTTQSQSSPLKIRLWSSSDTGVFYSDQACTQAIPSESVPNALLRLTSNLEYFPMLAAGSTSIQDIYYRDSTSGSHILKAVSTESSASVEMTVTITP